MRIVSLEGGLSRRPGLLQRTVRRLWTGVSSAFVERAQDSEDGLRPAKGANGERVDAYHAETRVIASYARRRLVRPGGVIAEGDIVAIAPLAGAAAASELLAVVLAPGALDRWRDARAASQAIGDIVLTVQRIAQAARRDRAPHRVYVLVYENAGKDRGDPVLVALNFEACRRPADGVREARERADLVNRLRQRFGVEAVARAALLGGEPSLILDSSLAQEPHRRFATGVALQRGAA